MFLTKRPWWVLLYEPYDFNSDLIPFLNRTSQFQRVTKPMESILRQVAAVQFAKDCRAHQLHVRTYGLYNEFGNKIWEDSMMFVNSYRRDIIYYLNVDSKAAFLDDDYCPNALNKFLCAHLPITNCSLPQACYDKVACHGTEENYNTATIDAVALPDRNANFFNIPQKDVPLFAPMSYYTYHYGTRGFNKKSLIYRKNGHPGDRLERIIAPMLLHRRNGDFRTLIAKEIKSMRDHAEPAFHANMSCVAIHIRHFDRHLPGEGNMIEWCDKFQRFSNGSCYDGSWNRRDCVS